MWPTKIAVAILALLLAVASSTGGAQLSAEIGVVFGIFLLVGAFVVKPNRRWPQVLLKTAIIFAGLLLIDLWWALQTFWKGDETSLILILGIPVVLFGLYYDSRHYRSAKDGDRSREPDQTG